MLRKVMAIMAVAMLFITGCATKVNDPESVTEGYRMAKVNDVLYYDTALDDETNAGADVADGTLKKAGAADEIPVENDTCNFDGATGYQISATEGEIEVCIDGKWTIFREVSITEEELVDLKYCKYMQGTLPGAEIVDKMLVLTSDRDATYNDVMTYYMNASSDDENEYFPIYLAEE